MGRIEGSARNCHSDHLLSTKSHPDVLTNQLHRRAYLSTDSRTNRQTLLVISTLFGFPLPRRASIGIEWKAYSIILSTPQLLLLPIWRGIRVMGHVSDPFLLRCDCKHRATIRRACLAATMLSSLVCGWCLIISVSSRHPLARYFTFRCPRFRLSVRRSCVALL